MALDLKWTSEELVAGFGVPGTLRRMRFQVGIVDFGPVPRVPSVFE